jgi:hypothetical protein
MFPGARVNSLPSIPKSAISLSIPLCFFSSQVETIRIDNCNCVVGLGSAHATGVPLVHGAFRK